MSARLARILAGVALATAVLVAVAGGGVLARHMLTQEASQAHAFVEEGRRALEQDDRGRAVLALERAKMLAPRDAKVGSALTALNVKDVEPLPPRALRLLTSREWFWVGLASGWVAGLGVALIVARRGRRRGLTWATFAAGVAFAGAATGLVNSALPLAVVSAHETALLVAPYPSASPEEVLPAGSMVTLGSAYEAFVQVRGADGVKGWARRASLEAVASPED